MRPDWNTLPTIPGHPDYRIVDGRWMTFEEYDTAMWRVVKELTTDTGLKLRYWAAPLDGLQAWGRFCHQRREAEFRARQYRREADDAWSDSVNADIEERTKP